MAEALIMRGAEHVLLVHSQDGLDEFSVSAPTDYLEVSGGDRAERTIEPAAVGLTRHPSDALAGGGPEENLGILNNLLKGADNAYREAVLFNAGAMIYVSGKADSIWSGVGMARDSIDWGAALKKLNDWKEASKGS
jgi:anthranilate phosphoribosyltransferase